MTSNTKMMSKTHIITLFLSLILGLSIQAQQNYLMFDYSISQYKSIQKNGTSVTGISEKLNRCEGNYLGGSYYFSIERNNSLSIGIGLSKIIYQKEWQGVFPESNQFGIATVNGQIDYWSFPVSYSWSSGSRPRSFYRCGGYRRDRLRFGFIITYTPSFEGRNSFSVNTLGGSDQTTFLSSFQSNEQAFQHSLTLGLSDQFYLLENRIRLDVESYAGIGSGFFKETGTNINNISYGVRFRIGIKAKLPKISIEKEVYKGNAEEKKKQLLEKQKQIQEQINKNKLPK